MQGALLVFGYCLVAFSLRAQPSLQQDPLMSMLLAQPRVDIEGPVTPTAEFDPPVLRPGEQGFYRITFNALEQSIELPPQIISQPRLQFQPGAHAQVLQQVLTPTGAKQVPLSAFNFRVRVTATGEVFVPEFVVRVYGKPVIVPAARLLVIGVGGAPFGSQRLQLELPETNVFVGQPIRARVRLPGGASGAIQGMSQVQFIGEGFIVDQGAVHQSIQTMPASQGVLAIYTYETTLIPIAPGTISMFAQGFTSGNRFSGSVVISGSATISGGAPQYTLLETEPGELFARPLPAEGELPGFTGGVGRFVLDTPQLSTNSVRVGDPIKLSVTVRNAGGSSAALSRLIAPPAPRAREWQVVANSPSAVPPQVVQAQGFLTLQYMLLPLTEKADTTPAIPFSYFDPSTGRYADLTIPAVPVQVMPGDIAADLRPLLQAEEAAVAAAGEQLSLSGLASAPGQMVATLTPPQQRAWFPVVQIAPAVVFLALCAWDRRRRYLREHPDILLRRRARRALRRQRRRARRAAAAGDAPQFADAAVSAMQVASAPHYPAEPRALVGADVLQLLAHGNGAGTEELGRTVQRFFAVADATQFAGAPVETGSLLALQPQLERVLAHLEEKL